MINFIRTLKFGTINFFGVVLPGFLLIFFSIVGFFLPALTLILYVSNSNWGYFEPLYLDTKWILAIIVILFSYVFGYILRLISPDELDDVSGKIVLDKYKKRLEGSSDEPWPKNWEEDGWPFSDDKGDKFPYYYFYRY